MNALQKPIVAVIVCLAAAVCFGAAAQLHAMARPAVASAAEAVDLTLADAVVTGRNAGTAVDFWMP